jgi:hypothetical protein
MVCNVNLSLLITVANTEHFLCAAHCGKCWTPHFSPLQSQILFEGWEGVGDFDVVSCMQGIYNQGER